MNQYEPWKELGISELDYWKKKYIESREETKIALDGLYKIYEPMKYHHWEEDAYTRAGCFQFVAQETLKKLKEIE